MFSTGGRITSISKCVSSCEPGKFAIRFYLESYGLNQNVSLVEVSCLAKSYVIINLEKDRSLFNISSRIIFILWFSPIILARDFPGSYWLS